LPKRKLWAFVFGLKIRIREYARNQMVERDLAPTLSPEMRAVGKASDNVERLVPAVPLLDVSSQIWSKLSLIRTSHRKSAGTSRLAVSAGSGVARKVVLPEKSAQATENMN
jgi:hypothetical protein